MLVISAEQEQALKAANVLCWHQNDVESEAMWQLYSRDIKSSLAIVVKRGVLKTLFDNSFSIEKIKYIYYRSEQPETDKAFLYKRKSFKHENELRIVHRSYFIEGAHCIFQQSLGDEGLGILLQKIHISPYAPERFDITLRGTLERFGIKSSIIPSNDFAKGIRY